MLNLTADQQRKLNDTNMVAREVKLGELIQDLIEGVTAGMPVTAGTPVNAVAATETLTISGVAIAGETITIGEDVYEFTADAAQTVTLETNIPVDIESYTVKSSGTLTIDTQPTSGNTMTIGSKVYTFVPAGTANADGEISIGTSVATAQTYIVEAINGIDGFNEPHPLVSASAFVADDCTITAIIGGVAGDAIGTTETFTAVTNVFAAAVLGSGADCVAANAVTAIVAAVTASDTQGVGAADGAGDTVVLTADTKGAAGNSIDVATSMANGAFVGTALAGGINGTVGFTNQAKIDSSYFYLCIADNTISGANWRRISLGTVY